jgi:hypothetical protein
MPAADRAAIGVVPAAVSAVTSLRQDVDQSSRGNLHDDIALALIGHRTDADDDHAPPAGSGLAVPVTSPA